ncbi:PAS domain-containing protein [Flavonifractor plautii]|nr:PAS domain-containing protein [Flavonifractor plautii]
MQLDPITRAVLDAMQEGVLIIDAQERIVYGNRAYVAFLEKEVSGPIGPIEGYPCGCCARRPAAGGAGPEAPHPAHPAPGERGHLLRQHVPHLRRSGGGGRPVGCHLLEGRLRLPGGAGAL